MKMIIHHRDAEVAERLPVLNLVKSNFVFSPLNGKQNHLPLSDLCASAVNMYLFSCLMAYRLNYQG